MEALYQTSLTALKGVIQEMTAFLPNLIAALVMLVAGWVTAKIAEKVVSRLLRTLRTNEATERMGMTGLFRQLGTQRSPVEFISRTIFWVFIAVFVVSTLEALKLVYVSQLAGRLVGYTPNVIGAALIVLVGLALARLFASSVGNSARNAGLEYATGLSAFVRYFLSLIVILAALAQVGVRTDILTNVVTVLIVSLGLALALALGLGSRAVVANILAGAFVREHLSVGSEIQVQGLKGKVVAVRSVGTSIESDGRRITIPNVVLIENVIE